ncbi:MAG: discoidin domain-containing protein, partial [Actinomycetota bacterium]
MGTTKIAIATCALLATALATTSGFASATEPVGPQRDTDRDFIPDDEDTVETSGAIVSTGQRTLQSSVSSGRLRNHPGAAVDGQRDGGRDGQQPMAITNDDGPWWEVDLGADHAIDGINVWNRTDGQQHLLAGAEVFISTAPLGDVDLASARAVAAWTATISDPTNVVQLAVPHTIGRYVRVQLPSGATPNLALAEVDVIGVEEPTNLLVNGSFEQGPDLPGPGGWKFAVVPGWTSAKHGNRTEIQAAGHAAPSSDGDFYIELNGSVADTVTQTVTVTPGA